VLESSTPRLKTTLVWHFWKTIENDPKTYPRFKPYIPLLFKGEFQEEPLSQYEFLIEKILPLSAREAVEIFKQEVEYLKPALTKNVRREDWTLWFHHPEEIIEAIAIHDPKSLPPILEVLMSISLRHGYVGNLTKIFSSYKKAPVELQEELSKQIVPMYELLQQKDSNLPPL
jgi:hypothetical protein